MPTKEQARSNGEEPRGARTASTPREAPEDPVQATPLSEIDESAAEAGEEIPVRWRKKDAALGAGAEQAAPGGETGDESRGEVQAKADEYLARWQRTAADMANMRRRHEQERQEYVKQANASLIAELLPVLDSFDLALEHMPDEVRSLNWSTGIVQVERQLRSALERVGLTPIEARGKPFDPNEHEALMQEESDLPEDTVTGELQRGYKLHDRVLRPAMVKVAKNS
jgi:molecular chaperone GrpE